MSKYLIVIERANGNFSEYSPDLPGCVATGRTKRAAETRMKRAIEMHLDGLREDGEAIPAPSPTAEYVEV